MNIKSFSPHKLSRWYLIHSMLYYVHDNPTLKDHDFDLICKELLTRVDKGDKIPKEFEEFITKENLEAGSGYDIYWNNLPQILQDCVHILNTGEDFSGNNINREDWLK